MRSVILMLPLWWFFLSVNGGEAAEKYTAPFLEIPAGIRQAALGSAGGGISGIPSAFFWNPSGIGSCKRPAIEAMHAWLFDGVATYDYIGGVVPLKGDAVFGLHGIRHAIPEVPLFPEWDPSNADSLVNAGNQGYLDYYDAAVYFTFSRLYKRVLDLGWQYFIIPVEFPWGVNLKWIRQKMDDTTSSSGIGIDIGTQAILDGKKVLGESEYIGKIVFGLAWQDIGGTKISWSTGHASTIGQNVKLSLGYRQTIRIIESECSVYYDYNTGYGDSHYGAEYQYRNSVFIRIGSDRGNLTTGAGLNARSIKADYAFGISELGYTHRISGGYSF